MLAGQVCAWRWCGEERSGASEQWEEAGQGERQPRCSSSRINRTGSVNTGEHLNGTKKNQIGNKNK